MKKVSIVIPVYIIDHRFFLITKYCIDYIMTNIYNIDVELIIVDDCSPNKKLVEILKKKCDKHVKWIHNRENVGFAHSINTGIANAKYDLILLLNNDITFTKNGWLERMIDSIENGGNDVVSADVGVISKRNWQYIPKSNRETVKNKIFKYPVGWCMMVKRSVFEQVGLFPTNFGRGYWEDTMYAIILDKLGYKMGAIVDLGIHHEEHKTFKAIGANLSKLYEKNREIFLKIQNGQEDCQLPKIEDYLI
jgi:GT2 family glycosyltransferase